MTVSSSDLRERAAGIGAPQHLTLRNDANTSPLNGSEDHIRVQETSRDNDTNGRIALIRGQTAQVVLDCQRSVHGAGHALVK